MFNIDVHTNSDIGFLKFLFENKQQPPSAGVLPKSWSEKHRKTHGKKHVSEPFF